MAAHSTSSVSLTWSAVTARRMARVALTEPSAELDPAGVAAVVCGVHAQVLTAAEISVGRRIAGATCTDVQRALWQDRTLVKTFGPRGTIHLLPAAELPMWTGALSAVSSPPTHPEGVRFTPEQIEEVIAAIGEALADAELTVDELTQAIAEGTGPWAVEQTMEAFGGKWPRWRQLTSVAAHRGVLCFGPNRARNVTYTNPARWLPAFRPLDADLALRSCSPATSTPTARQRRSTSPSGSPFPRAPPPTFSAGCPPTWNASTWTAPRPGPSPPTPRRLPPGRRHPPAALLRRIRGCGLAPGPAVSGRGRSPRALTGRPGRKLPGRARQRRRGRHLALAPLWPQADHHR